MIHNAWALVPSAELNVAAIFGVTVIVPVAYTDPQPVNGML